jgi:prephenate dehydrogenase
MLVNNLVIVGVGLIGGSIGAAVRRRGVARCVRGLGRKPESLETAHRLGQIDEAHLEPTEALRDADFVVVCTPVDHIAKQVLAYARLAPRGAVLTDAGSTKALLVDEIESAVPDHVAFVGSHPLAGSEKRGPEHADAELFEGRWAILTPTPRTSGEALQRVRAFWQALGCKVREMSPAEHDQALALTSHLPHLLASALAGVIPPELAPLCASGYRDTTRIAMGDAELWRAIFLHNRDATLAALDRLEGRLGAFRAALEARDAATLERLLLEGKSLRQQVQFPGETRTT